MVYEEGVGNVPAAITDDSLWRVKAYRIALFAAVSEASSWGSARPSFA